MLDTKSDDMIIKQIVEQYLKTCPEHEQDQTREMVRFYERELDEREDVEVDNFTIDGCISDLISNFLYYDRKEDEQLPLGEIEKAVKRGKITVDFMVDSFRKHLTEGLEK